MKDSNYIVIQGWMVNQLKLKGNDLMLFAVIYGFSQDEESEFTGSLNYLCVALNCSRNTAKKSLKNLTDKKFIKKNTQVVNGVTFNKYSVIDGGGQFLTEGVSKTPIEGGQFLTGGGAVSDPNNTINNTINNKNINNRKLDFEKSLIPFLNIYKKPMLREFADFWCEHGVKDRKLRFEKEKTFGLKRRLTTWHNSKYNNHKNDLSKGDAIINAVERIKNQKRRDI